MNALDYLNNYKKNDYTFDRVEKFLKKSKFFYEIPTIHIAGTNGKGSTAFYLAKMLIANGYNVGLFISPFYNLPNESILYNNLPINDDDFINNALRYEKHFKNADFTPSEVLSIVALSYFQEKKCDIAIVECMMGGEEDCTNVFTPLLSIITTISLEHTDFLGKSISQIALAKVGIIRKNTPLLVGKLPEEAMDAIKPYAAKLKSKIYTMTDYEIEYIGPNGVIFTYSKYEHVHLDNCSEYSAYNASLSFEALEVIRDKFPCDMEINKNAIKNVSLESRFSLIHKEPIVILDGAHNPEAIKKLVTCFEKYGSIEPLHIVFASFKDKNIVTMLPTLSVLSNDIYLTSFPHPRARTKDDYLLFLSDYHYEDDYQKLIKDLILKYPHDTILITGSLNFATRVYYDFKDKIFD